MELELDYKTLGLIILGFSKNKDINDYIKDSLFKTFKELEIPAGVISVVNGNYIKLIEFNNGRLKKLAPIDVIGFYFLGLINEDNSAKMLNIPTDKFKLLIEKFLRRLSSNE